MFKAICACGQASISVTALPTDHGICHCTNCKRRTGSAFGISTYFDRSAVAEIFGETHVYEFFNTTHQHHQQRHFCPRCGTTLYWTVSTLPEKIGIAGGCFADHDIGAPTYSTNDRKRLPWVTIPTEWSTYQG